MQSDDAGAAGSFERCGIAIDGQYRMPLRCQQARMTPAAARQVQHFARGNRLRETGHPGGWLRNRRMGKSHRQR